MLIVFNNSVLLLQCYKKHNSQEHPEYPLCGVQLKDFMFAAKDTPTCMRKTHMPNPTESRSFELRTCSSVKLAMYRVNGLPVMK